MTREQNVVDEMRNLLLERKRRLWAELREDVFRNGAEELHSQYDIPQDLGDGSILALLSDEGLALADVRCEELTRLEEAERKLDRGTYGICDECGEEIGLARLKLVPFAAYCVSCQAEREPKQKPPGTKM